MKMTVKQWTLLIRIVEAEKAKAESAYRTACKQEVDEETRKSTWRKFDELCDIAYILNNTEI